MHQVEGRLKRELLQLATLKSPEEAVGLILASGRVIELTNIAESREAAFEVDRDEIIALLHDEVDILDVTFWHSHPSGSIGPSSLDMRSRTPFGYHLVVSLVNGDLVATWY